MATITHLDVLRWHCALPNLIYKMKSEQHKYVRLLKLKAGVCHQRDAQVHHFNSLFAIIVQSIMYFITKVPPRRNI